MLLAQKSQYLGLQDNLQEQISILQEELEIYGYQSDQPRIDLLIYRLEQLRFRIKYTFNRFKHSTPEIYDQWCLVTALLKEQSTASQDHFQYLQAHFLLVYMKNYEDEIFPDLNKNPQESVFNKFNKLDCLLTQKIDDISQKAETKETSTIITIAPSFMKERTLSNDQEQFTRIPDSLGRLQDSKVYVFYSCGIQEALEDRLKIENYPNKGCAEPNRNAMTMKFGDVIFLKPFVSCRYVYS